MIIFFVFIAFLIGMIAWGFHSDKKRREGLAAVAEEMGLVYSQDGDSESLQHFQDFHLFSRGRAKKMRNVMHGDSGEVKLAIFDYMFTTGSGKNRRTNSQTVASIESPELQAPSFFIRPTSILDRVGSAIGIKDINFESHPNFSSTFVLKGKEAEAIRRFMVPRILEYFEQHSDISVEASGNKLIFYRPNRRASADQVKELFAQAYETFGVMVDA